ncbi:unnamed protein product [Arctia plantaginis]|uniref:Uncharacterized protein n=1 Tax=Arctia plantaginis TaxID=874455 RepID=A0A8S1ABG9_ARCPL|nr:unnamed protein product [Arctia plantaginis]
MQPSLTKAKSITRRLGLPRPARRHRLDVQVPTAHAASWVARYTACSDQIFTSQRHQRQPQIRHKRHTRIGSSKKSGNRHRQQSSESKESGLDLSDLDLSAIEFSEREMRALSGLTPALSRRLQRQLLAHLPPAAARSLRRTLSLHAPAPQPPRAARSLSADQPADKTDAQPPAATAPPSPAISPDVADVATPHYSTLPRLRNRSETREGTLSLDAESASLSTGRAAERPLLSKYLTPERALSLDESCGSDAASATSEPSCASPLRRPSPRAAPSTATELPRRRISRFLRSDFFDSPPDENLYERHRKEREMETQKILREIREKKNRQETGARNPQEAVEAPTAYRDDNAIPKKSLSPITLLAAKDRSRSNTPFFPILDNIKETTVDTALSTLAPKRYANIENTRQKSSSEETSTPKESRLIRPRSYPVKTLDSIDEPSESVLPETSLGVELENKDRSLPKESKLLRPKSYPASSPSPEKVYISRTIKKEDSKSLSPEDKIDNPETNNDIEVSFSITLPKKTKVDATSTSQPLNSNILEHSNDLKSELDSKSSENSLLLKKYQIVKNKESDMSEMTKVKTDKSSAIPNGDPHDESLKGLSNGEAKNKTLIQPMKKDDENSKIGESDLSEKKGTVKKKIIRKVSSKSKTDLVDTSDTKNTTEKKKVSKKGKEKVCDEDGGKSTTVTKKKSMLQSIGQKLEKFASTKSSSPENSATTATKKNIKLSRMQREQSVPVNVEPTTESNLIKRAVTLTDVAALENQTAQQSKTTVSKVLGLFKKFEPKEKTKQIIEKSMSESIEDHNNTNPKIDSTTEAVVDNLDKDKPRRPTSLLLNGIGRKNKYGRTSSDSIATLTVDNDEQSVSKKENESKNIKNSLKLDFSRLPRVKKIVPTNPVIEPQIMDISSVDSETEKINIPEKNTVILESSSNIDNAESQSRSRSRSRSTISNSELKCGLSADAKLADKNPMYPSEGTSAPLRTHDPTTPEKEDIVDRIRRKSFYSRFNEKKQRRKSSLVGPGAAEYDPVARIHSQPTDSKYDMSPTSPLTYDLSPMSPGLSVSSDLSPSTERYRSLLADLPVNTRSNLRFENYGLNDKIDTYRSLDRNDFRKYPGSRSYLEYEQPTYGTSRYARTKSLLENSDITEENNSVGNLRDSHKYNRTLSMYSPGNYATYRPKRTTRNSAIILKESEKEPSPENILDKIKQRKISISVTRKPDSEKEPLPRSNISSKGEGDGAECFEKVD